jgi:hypothetical protein
LFFDYSLQMPDNHQPSSRWWQTVPGILTGIAAVITAVTGLVIAYNSLSHSGIRTEEPRPASSSAAVGTKPVSPPVSSAAHASIPVNGAAAKPVPLPEIHRVKLSSSAADYTILSAEIEPLDAESRSLKFAVRFVNGGRYPSNLWSRSFRLIVDNVPRAPTNSLNEVVPADSGKDGDVIFEVPAGTKDVVLQISAGDEKSRIPLKLP